MTTVKNEHFFSNDKQIVSITIEVKAKNQQQSQPYRWSIDFDFTKTPVSNSNVCKIMIGMRRFDTVTVEEVQPNVQWPSCALFTK